MGEEGKEKKRRRGEWMRGEEREDKREEKRRERKTLLKKSTEYPDLKTWVLF
jgi:hypothetical protein